MSKILFSLLFSSILGFQAQAAVSNPGNVANPKDERSICESAFMAVQHWAAQIKEDATITKTKGACTQELNFAEQSFPIMLKECVAVVYSTLPAKTREDWSKHSWRGLALLKPESQLGPFSETVHSETTSQIQALCKKKPAK
jgi:hypothetical protein